MVRCKFKCASVTKRANWDPNKAAFLYEAEFFAVSSGSEENKRFFDSTPVANLKLAIYKDDLFTPGEEYYVDLTESNV